jgi:hypothetical protein
MKEHILELLRLDLEYAKKEALTYYLSDYEQGVADGIVEGLEDTIKMIEGLDE